MLGEVAVGWLVLCPVLLEHASELRPQLGPDLQRANLDADELPLAELLPHNLVARTAHVTVPSVSGSPGEQSVTMVLHFPKPGHYPFVCTYHADAGMRGEFVVTA